MAHRPLNRVNNSQFLDARLSRRGLFAAAAAAAAAACGGDDGDSSGTDDSTGSPNPASTVGQRPVELEFWGWVPGLEDAVKAWNQANPNIQIKFHRMTGDDGAKIPPAIDAGTAPDVFQLPTSNVPEQIVAGRLLDIREYVNDVSDAFDETAWSSVSFNDAIYGVPQDATPSGLLYRTDIFDKHGVDVPTTWEDYLEAGRALKAANPDIFLAQLSPNEAGFWIQQVWQAGGSFYGIDGDSWTVTANDEHSQEVAELWQMALDEELFKVVEMWTPEYWKEVNQGHIATINYQAWFPQLLQENAGDLTGKWAATHSPRIGGEESAGSGGYGGNSVPHNSEYPEEAVTFAKWLNTSDDGLRFLIEEGGVFPAALAGLESPALRKPSAYFGGQAVNEVFLEEATKVPPTWTTGPTHNLTQDHIKDNFAQVANDTTTFVNALDSVTDATRQDLEDAGLSVQ